jgi:conserved hypothetical protein
MADTILILGNGFDIAMGRKTKYEEFIEFTNDLSSRKKYIVNFRKFIKPYKKIKLSNYKDNLYLKFINENKDTLGENWSNLEIMISNIADAIMYFKENSNNLFNDNVYESDKDYLRRLKNKLRRTNNGIAKIFVVEKFYEFNSTKNWNLVQRDDALEKLNTEFINQLDSLIDLLEIYLSYIDFLDFKVNKIKPSPTALDAVNGLSRAYVLNFNYTNTFGRLFHSFKERTHFIHGQINLGRPIGKINTMVFGIEDKEINVNSDLIPYQKYYQRVVKETGSEFEKFFSRTNYTKENLSIQGRNIPISHITSKNIVVFGHSVDPLDKEIFQKCFALAEEGGYSYRFIFTYFDEAAKRSIVKNLAIILSKEKLVELTGKRNVVFIKSDDKAGMEEVLLP